MFSCVRVGVVCVGGVCGVVCVCVCGGVCVCVCVWGGVWGGVCVCGGVWVGGSACVWWCVEWGEVASYRPFNTHCV